MAKRGEIPADKSRERTYKHAATVDQVEELKGRVEALGWGWHDAVRDAGVSRNTGYTLLRGRGSVGSMRTIEEWVRRKEGESPQPASPQDAWAKLGEELAALGDDQLGGIIESLREYVSAERRRRAAFSKLLRITPDRR